MLDIPTAWAISRHARLEHHPDCSYRTEGGALLCDCQSVEREWERLRAQAMGERALPA